VTADTSRPDPSSKALAVVNRLVALGIAGAGPLKSSVELADEYLGDPRYESIRARVDALVRWETTKNFTSRSPPALGA